jgi:hypothetical protein
MRRRTPVLRLYGYRSLLGAATMHALYPEFLTREWQQRAGRIRQARKAHAVIRASGRALLGSVGWLWVLRPVHTHS